MNSLVTVNLSSSIYKMDDYQQEKLILMMAKREKRKNGSLFCSSIVERMFIKESAQKESKSETNTEIRATHSEN